MLSLKNFFNEEFIFIFRTETFDKEFIEEINRKIGIKKYKFKIIDECTEGQAATALKVNNLIKENESVVIYNINTHIKPSELSLEHIKSDTDVFMITDYEKHTKYKQNLNKEVTTSLYYFKSWEDFMYIYNKYISYVKCKNNEACIEGMIEYFIIEGKKVQTQLISSIDIYKLNTPQGIILFTEKLN